MKALRPFGFAAAISGQPHRYHAALNAGDIGTVMTLYPEDGVFMPQNGPPAGWRKAVRDAYVHVFQSMKLDVRFTMDEIRPLSADRAFARTRSAGNTTVLATGATGPEANLEIFIMHRDRDGAWRFARYIFATTNPPRSN